MWLALLSALIAQGPLPPTPYSLDVDEPAGVGLAARAEAAWIDGDPLVGVALRPSLELDAFALQLDVPLFVRVVDVPPTVDDSAPLACHVLRCEELAPNGAFSAASVLRVVEHVRLLQAGDVVFAEGGRLTTTLGHGALVERATNTIDWDHRKAGARVDVTAGPFRARAFVNDVLAPWELLGTRAELAPLAFFSGDSPDWLARLAERGRVGFEFAGDLTAPDGPGAVDRNGDLVLGAPSRALLGGVVDVAWPLLDDHMGVQVAPWANGSALYGLSETGGPTGVFAPGAAFGLDVDVGLHAVSLRAQARVDAHAPGHRRGVFGALYDVERRRALRGSVVDGAGVVRVPAPGGIDGSVLLETMLFDMVKLGARLDVERAPGASDLEAWLEVGAGPVRVGARALRRGITSARDAVGVDDATFVIAEAAVHLGGPFSAVGRYYRLPRFDRATGKPAADDDLYLGVSCDLFLRPLP